MEITRVDINLSSQFTNHVVQEPSNILRSKIVEDLELERERSIGKSVKHLQELHSRIEN